MREKTISEILGDFSPNEASSSIKRDGQPVTIWLPAEAKARYDKLQKNSGRKFSKKARETLIALIEIAEAKTG